MRKFAAIALLFLAACGGTDETVLEPVEFSDLPGWQHDQHADALKVFNDSCAVNKRRANGWKTKLGEPVGDYNSWVAVCDRAAQLFVPKEDPMTPLVDEGMLPPLPVGPTNDEARQFFERHFQPVRVMTGRESKGLLTGYYEPMLHGAAKRGGPYQTPVYGVPAGKKDFSRAEIEAGALNGKAPVLLYVEDPVMLFFLHIQGSGKVQMDDGSIIGLQYAGQNGHQYVAIGKPMKEMGMLQEVTLQTIRDWLHQHPGAPAQEVMNLNPSYIYFKLSPGEEYAKGALGIPLTPLRSVAIDDDRATYGVPTYIATTRVNQHMGYTEKLRRLMVSQDTGGALHGPHRGDIFFGRGDAEEWSAGHQNARGKVYWLLPVMNDFAIGSW